jgi:two-component system, OmpR family, phosphate regulon response regulator OmpR
MGMKMNVRKSGQEKAHLLVVDDDDRIRSLLKTYLSKHQFRISTASDAAKVRRLLQTLEFDLVVLDIMMPGEDGLSLTRFIRHAGTLPILLLSARGSPEERIEGLRAGADDYLAKPFEPEELLLRIDAILRRQRTHYADGASLCFGDWCFTPQTGELTGASGRVALTDGEVRLLAALAKRPGEAFSRQDLSRDSGAVERSIDVQIARLRRKIESNPRHPQFLQTVRGAGYRLLAHYAAGSPGP